MFNGETPNSPLKKLEVEFNVENSHLRIWNTHISLSSQASVFGACSWEADFVLIMPLLKCKQVHEESNYLYDREI